MSTSQILTGYEVMKGMIGNVLQDGGFVNIANTESQKENIETQLINQDRLNRQTMMSKNVDAYNQWLNNFIQSKSNKAALKANNFNNLISGLTGGIGDMLSRIESRRATNNTIQAITDH